MMYLIPMEINNQRIMTTKVLAEQFGTEERRITENFKRNEERFVQGKHYLLLEGEILREFKRDYAERVPVNVNKLYLWTDRGAARHAKILGTDEAWDVYEALEDTYFKVINNQIESNKQPIGIVESLHLELEASNKRIAELEQIVFAKQRRKLASKKHKLKISSTLEQRLDNISNETVLEIIRTVLPVGTLRILDEGIAIDKKIVYKEVGRRHISKYDFNKKLKLLGIVVLSSEDYPYKQVRMNNTSIWCYVIKHNLIDN